MQKLAYLVEYPISSWVSYELDALAKRDIRPLVCVTHVAGEEKISGSLKTRWVAYWLAILKSIFCSPMKVTALFMTWKNEIGKRMFFRSVYLAHELQKKNIEHIHAHFAAGAGSVAFIIKKLSGIKYSITTHAYDIFRADMDIGRLKIKLRGAELVRCISQYNKAFLLEKYPSIPEKKIRVIYCGVDIRRFKPKENPKLSGDRIVAIANLVEKKGLIYLVKACELLKKSKIQFRCDIYGDGYKYQELSDFILREGLQQQVFLLGSCPNSEIPNKLNAAGVFVLPCIEAENGDRDGIPVTLMEAMASGVPVIATNISGIPELIDSGKNGTLVRPARVDELADAIKEVLGSDYLKKRYASSAREKIIQRFNIDAVALELEAFFKEQNL